MSRLHEFIWFEKYRPKQLKELALQKAHRAIFKQYIDQGEIPHLLLSGPQGSGKTTVAKVLIGEIPSTVLTLNASSERGIDVVRDKVKTFASSMARKGQLKIVLLDEADALTAEAQTALRNTMETYNKNCRFILTCNYPDKIIAPIQSRCTKFAFGESYPIQKLMIQFKKILEAEGIEGVQDEDLRDLIDRWGADIRSMINDLHMACASGTFDKRALGQLAVDPVLICELIKGGRWFKAREEIKGITSFTFLYKYLTDVFVPQYDDPIAVGLMISAIRDASNVEMTVPDREINFIGCFVDICDALDVKLTKS